MKVTTSDLFNGNVASRLRETLIRNSQVSRTEARSPSQGSNTAHQYSNMKPNGIGKREITRTPIFNTVQKNQNGDDGDVAARAVSQTSVPLSAIRSVESSHGGEDLMPSKQLTSMMLVSDGIDTTRNNLQGDSTCLPHTSARERAPGQLTVNT